MWKDYELVADSNTETNS
uniref:Uncharacterized protein n=1 Tax=Arundo donax TaxID=35708 RepID=A0A0A8YI24_ARUDO